MRLDAFPALARVLATALAATIADPNAFRSGRASRSGITGAEAALKRW